MAGAGRSWREAGAGCWGFSNSGVILVEASDVDPEEIALEAVDKGAEDFDIEGSSIEFKAAFTDFEPLKAALEAMDGVEVVSAELAMVPSTLFELDDAKARQTLRLLATRGELEDVQGVFSNADFRDEGRAGYAEAG